VISSLGLTGMSPDLRVRTVRAAKECLAPSGVMTQFRYLTSQAPVLDFRNTEIRWFQTRNLLSGYFPRVSSKRVRLNLPPAEVYAPVGEPGAAPYSTAPTIVAKLFQVSPYQRSVPCQLNSCATTATASDRAVVTPAQEDRFRDGASPVVVDAGECPHRSHWHVPLTLQLIPASASVATLE
jgi:hypothetical protein